MPGSGRRSLAELHAFVTTVCADAVFRRLVRYRPEQAFAAFGLSGAKPAGQLPVRHLDISVVLDKATMLGPEPRRVGGNLDGEFPIEARLVLYGVRGLALLHGSEVEMAALGRWLEGHGLVALLSPTEFHPRAEPAKGGYANLADRPRPARAGSGAWRALVVGATVDAAFLGWLCLLFGWDAYLGQLLGYPACCVHAFEQRWALARRSFDGDVAFALLSEPGTPAVSADLPWQNNVYARYLMPTVTAHFPCRLDCPESAALADRVLAVLRLHEPGLATRLPPNLAAPVLVTSADGVFVLEGARPERRGHHTVLRFDPDRMLTTSGTSPVAAALRGAGAIVAGEPLTVDDADATPIPGWLLIFRHPSHAGEEGDRALPFGPTPRGV